MYSNHYKEFKKNFVYTRDIKRLTSANEVALFPGDNISNIDWVSHILECIKLTILE